MIVYTMPQNLGPPDYEPNPEWLAARMGLPTASVADSIITAKGGTSKMGDKYITTLIAEKLGIAQGKNFKSRSMARGTAMESESRALFELTFDLDITEVGVCTNGDGTAAFSPDGLISIPPNGSWWYGWETKCPIAETQIAYLMNANDYRIDHPASGHVYTEEALPSAYKQQVHYSLAVSNLPGWWFSTYHPGLDPIFIFVKPSRYTVKMRVAIKAFLQQYEEAKQRFGLA
jgi:hypothetical protein